MSSIDPRKPKWAPKEPRRPQDASDTSEESEDEYLRRAAPYEVRLQLGNIEYGQDVAYYDDNQPNMADITYLQKKQAFTDRSLYIKDKKGRIIRNIDQEKIDKRKLEKKERFKRKKLEKKNKKLEKNNLGLENQSDNDLELKQLGLPVSFGKKQEDEISEISYKSEGNSAGTHESDYEETEELPITHEVDIESHSRPVTDIDINQLSTVMATGSLDYKVHFYDFGLMDENLRSFRFFEPIDGHPIRNVKYSLDNKHILICAGGVQPKIFSKEGRLHFECVKGDMYMTDMSNTHGHTNMVTECAWHPSKPTYFLSSSLDSTVRVWDLAGRLVGLDRQLGHKTLHKARSSNYTKIGVDSCAWAPNGNYVLGGCSDGSIQMWETTKGNSLQPKIVVAKAHLEEITAFKFFADNQTFLSRSHDGTMKLWDLRSIKQAVFSWNLPCSNYKNQIDLSPDEKYIVTGTSPDEKAATSYLKVISASNYQEIAQVPYDKPVIAVKWHREFNQIFIGSADCTVKVLFRPRISTGGVLACLKRKTKIKSTNEMFMNKPIITPYSLSQFRINYTSREKTFAKLREDPVLSYKPKEPLFDPGKDGRMSGINTVTQYILRSIHEKVRPEDDPREALISYNPESVSNPEWVTPAYKNTQPKPIFDYTIETHEEREYLDKNPAPKCKSCGLKFCTCAKRRTGDDPIFSVEK
jgi:WD repeat-containing protein 70